MIEYKPKRLTNKSIWEQADLFRESKEYGKEIPVKIEKLIEFELNMDIIPITGLKELSGVKAFLSLNLKGIRVDRKAYDNPNYLPRLRFTLAEEVGHYILHKEIYQEGVSYNSEEEFIQDILNMDENDLSWIEKQARQFAGRLLVPTETLFQQIKSNEEKIDQLYAINQDEENSRSLAIEGVSKRICDNFQVSWQVIRNRIGYENLKYLFER